jgi:hypothetical protein
LFHRAVEMNRHTSGMRRLRFLVLLPLLPGCAITPAPPAASGDTSSFWVNWPEWTPVPLSLLGSTENGVALVFIARAAMQQQASAVGKPFPVPMPAKPDTRVSTTPEGIKVEYAKAGDRVEFVATAEGSQPLSYKWIKDGKEMPDKTGPLLTFEPVREGDGGTYECIVTNSIGFATSLPFKLVVQ